MYRFILLTFGLLGLTFYQMSGGGDFHPPARPVIVETALEPAAAPVEVAAETPVSNEVSLSRTLPQMERPAADPETENDTTLAPRQVSATIREVIEDDTAVATQSAAVETAEQVTAVDTDTTEQTLIVPSLITDIRSVTGNSVNMRSGPGTDFDVVDRLSRGSEVEVLQDPGTGWLELRVVDSGVTGWIADWLVSAS